MITGRTAGRALVASIMMGAVLAVTAAPAYAIGTLSVGDATIAEGTGGSTTLTFVVSLSTANLLPVTVGYATSDGSAAAASDYTAASGTLTIPVGATSANISVTLAADAFPEPNETLNLTLSNPSIGTSIGDGSAIGTIANDDGLPPTLTIDDPATIETDAAGSVAFTVSLPGPATQDTTVAYATASGTAATGADFGAVSGTATIAAGEASAIVPVTIVGDQLDEADESFSVTLSTPTNATIADSTGTATIVDDDDAPTAQADAPAVGETDGATVLGFTVTLDAPSGRTAAVDYATSDGSATAGVDYTSASGTLVFAPGDVSETVTVSVVGDNLDEPDETVTLTLSGAVNAVISQPTSTGTIVDDEPAPALSIADLTVTEGDSGTSSAEVIVTLSAASGQTVAVHAATTGTGTATAGSDYEAAQADITFPAGVTSRTLTVPVLGDLLDESNETVVVVLSNEVGAVIADGSATLMVADDDATPTLSLSDAALDEGDAGNVPATLTLTLSAPSGRDVSVAVSTSNGTATGGADFAAQTGTIIQIPAGATTAPVPYAVFGDVIDEADETFALDLAGATNAGIADSAGTVTILDDDAGPSISIDDVTQLEGTGSAETDTVFTFTVALSAASEQTVNVAYATADASATAGVSGDYDAKTGTVTFAPGQQTRPITVNVNRDADAEPSEAFLVELSVPTNAVLSVDATGTGTILNDDGPAAAISIADLSIAEGAGTAEVTLTLSKPVAQDITVDVMSSNGTATAPADYGAVVATTTFSAGQTSTSTDVAIADDAIDEPDEVFTLTLSNARNAVVADGTATVTVTDDDATPSLSIADVSVTEGSTATLTVSLSGPSSQTITVQATTADGTATAGDDYTATATALSFAPGETSAMVLVDTATDAITEGDETLTVSLSSPTGDAMIADGSSTVTIMESAPLLSVADAGTTEGSTATVVVTLSAQSSQTITVRLTTADDTATVGEDYTAVDTEMTFPPGQTTAEVLVATVDDTLFEGDEAVTIALGSPSGATIGDATAVLTIADDDAEPTISIADTSATEGDSGDTPAEFVVSLSGPSDQSITVQATASDGTAGGSDHGTLDATVTFAPGETQTTTTIQVTGDVAPEADEAFYVTLTDPVGATIADSTGVGTIRDDDAAGTFTPLAPTRLLDTRIGLGRSGTSQVAAGQIVTLQVTGVGGVPASGVAAIVLNVTVTGPAGPGFVSVTPTGGSSTSNLNFSTQEDVANLVIVPVAPDGSVRLFTSQATHLIADVSGWFASDAMTTPGSHFTDAQPTRVLDTRTGVGVPGGGTTPLTGGVPRVLDVTGVGGVPATGVTAVILNVTVTQPTAASFLSVTPTGGTATSNINFSASETAAGLVVVPVDPDGSIRFAVGSGTTHVIADVFGWFATPGSLTGSVLTAVDPARLLDTRSDPGGPLGPDEAGFLPIDGEGGVPVDGVDAAVLNLTATQPTAPSYLVATPDGEQGTSNLNFVANQTVANLAVVPVNPDFGDVVIYNNAGQVHVIVDVFAWFSTPAT